MTKQHAKLRPPSSADRWLSCPGSVRAVRLYPNESSAASLEGDEAHDVFESCLLFGTYPFSPNPDINDNVLLGLEWVEAQRQRFPGLKVYAEQQLEIPATGEFGTSDVVMVHPEFLHIADYKNGYIVVELGKTPGNNYPNGQMMNYLDGAIGKYGARPKYFITAIQPNASHIDGPIRTIEITETDLETFRQRVAWSMSSDQFYADKHCKKTYCPHRGACASFLQWADEHPVHSWHPAEVNSFDDIKLATALDTSEVLQGYRDELRKEALRRILNLNRTIHGYKVVKGRKEREIADKAEVKRILIEGLGFTENDLYETEYETIGGVKTVVSRKFISAAGAERLVKAYAQRLKLPNGGWKKIYENTIGQYIREFSGNLTLERATDGRPAHTRGSEFGQLIAPDTNTSLTV